MGTLTVLHLLLLLGTVDGFQSNDVEGQLVPMSSKKEVVDSTDYPEGKANIVAKVNDDTAIPSVSGTQYDLDAQKRLPICKVTLNKNSAKILQSAFQYYEPNFARLKLVFKGKHVGFTKEVIQPFIWYWTFYSTHELFAYLKWPADFSVLSFGLLDSRTLPDGHRLYLTVSDTECFLQIGDFNSVMAIAEALGNFTRDFLVPTRIEENLSYSYWCYHAEIPNKQHNFLHSLRAYTGFPIQVAAYNCCNTVNDRLNKSIMHVDCNRKQIYRSFASLLVPYLMTLVAFAFFPVFLLQFSDATAASDHRLSDQQQILPVNEDETGAGLSYIYFDGSPPISISKYMSSLFGLTEKYPYAVSRFRRFVFVVMITILIFIRLYVYRKNTYLHSAVLALLQHKCPIGFISMLGGFELSREAYLTDLGGPFAVLIGFYVFSMFFVILPQSVDKIFEDAVKGSTRSNAPRSPLCFSLYDIEVYSGNKITTCYGYGKAAGLCSGGVFMLTNPVFWKYFLLLQIKRFPNTYTFLVRHTNKYLAVIIFCLFLPFQLLINTIETAGSIFIYGIPVIHFFKIVIRGYTLHLVDVFTSSSVMSQIGRLLVIRAICYFAVGLVLLYYIVAACTIFTDSLIFVSKLLIFSFLSVIVYPSNSFGYIFFGLVFIYYIVKMLSGFGERYQELLSDIVEVCYQLDEDPQKLQIVDGTLIVSDIRGNRISRLQVHNTVIDLSHDQVISVRGSTLTRAAKLSHKNHMVGIPIDLFMTIVRKYRPVHKQLSFIVLRLMLIFCLIYITFSIISIKPLGLIGISEVMHVVFMIAIGALPKILEIAFDNRSRSAKRDIMLQRLKSDVIAYWQQESDFALFE